MPPRKPAPKRKTVLKRGPSMGMTPKIAPQITTAESSRPRMAAIASLARMGETLARALDRPDIEVTMKGDITCRDLSIGTGASLGL